VLAALLLLPAPGLADPAPGAKSSAALADSIERGSYSLGYQVGSELERNGRRLDPETFLAGLRDGLAAVEPQLADHEIEKIVSRAKPTLMKRTRDRRAYMAEGLDYLEANGREPSVTSLPSGLQYAVLEPGRGRRPAIDDLVRIRYRGSLVDGRTFHDSFAKPQAETVRVGDSIEGIAEALRLMPVGARWRLAVPPLRGYETDDSPLAYRTLVIELELEAIVTDGDLAGQEPRP